MGIAQSSFQKPRKGGDGEEGKSSSPASGVELWVSIKAKTTCKRTRAVRKKKVAFVATQRGLVVGNSAEADLVIDDPNLSGKHAVVRQTEDGEVALESFGRTYFLIGQGVKSSGIHPIFKDQVVKMGACSLQVTETCVESQWQKAAAASKALAESRARGESVSPAKAGGGTLLATEATALGADGSGEGGEGGGAAGAGAGSGKGGGKAAKAVTDAVGSGGGSVGSAAASGDAEVTVGTLPGATGIDDETEGGASDAGGGGGADDEDFDLSKTRPTGASAGAGGGDEAAGISSSAPVVHELSPDDDSDDSDDDKEGTGAAPVSGVAMSGIETHGHGTVMMLENDADVVAPPPIPDDAQDPGMCYICFDDSSEPGNELVNSPCSCAKLVHRTCLSKWIATKGSRLCSICKSKLPIDFTVDAPYLVLQVVRHMRGLHWSGEREYIISFNQRRNNVVTVGSDHDCDLNLPDPSLSRTHSRILFRDNTFYVEDLMSSAGTFLRVSDPHVIGTDQSGQFKLGRTNLTIKVKRKRSLLRWRSKKKDMS